MELFAGFESVYICTRRQANLIVPQQEIHQAEDSYFDLFHSSLFI